MSIDWSACQIVIRTVKGKLRRERYYLVTCQCGCQRLLRKHDALKRQTCFHCSQREKGRKGYQATVQRYGANFAIHHVRRHRLENPSSLEKRFIELLLDAGISYEREFLLEAHNTFYLIDFIIVGKGITLAIEINGSYWHAQRQELDAAKHQAIVEIGGLHLLIFDEHTLADSINQITQFL